MAAAQGFGERVHGAMLAAGIVSPAELARACGVSRPAAQNWLAMRQPRLSAACLLRLSTVLRVRMRWLMTGAGAVPMTEQLDAATEILARLTSDEAEAWIAEGRRRMGG